MEIPQYGGCPARIIEQLDAIEHLEPVDAYQGEVLELIRSGLAAGTEAVDVSRDVADANDALTRRLLELAEVRLGQHTLRYRWLALGSHGRREQVLSSDQDHAIAYEQPPPGEEEAAQDYFRSLAALVVPGLARAGLPLCSGGYMATQWCRPIGEYKRLFRMWVDEPQPLALLQAEVFLDVRGCHGELSTGDLDGIRLGGGSRGPFRVQMARAAVAFRPPSARFGRRRNASSLVDLKLGGTAAIVLLARLYALVAGSTAHGTVSRLQAAAEAEALSPNAAASLVEAYQFLTHLRLVHQIEQVAAGVPADNRIPLSRLTGDETRHLRHTLHLVRDLQDVTAMRYSTSSVT